MENGLYEKILDDVIKETLRTKAFKEIREVDHGEVPRVLAMTYQILIRDALSQILDFESRKKFIKNLNKAIGIDNFDDSMKKLQEVLVIHDSEMEFNQLKAYRPRTSIATSTLFTGYTGPTLESELSREIRTADEIDFLISFIKYSGLRLIYDDLAEFTKKGRLRVITTSYMGASDYKAILELSKLPNTEVKISYETKRTRLHAKAYYFKRNTGFSTAYIGSSNLSNPALSSGLEWNLKVSEHTSKDVVDGFVKNFETYWNDDEFVTFAHTEKEARIELKQSLQFPQRLDTGHVFFDLRPYPHQKQILEDLKVEREEYNSYKNLVVAATGNVS